MDLEERARRLTTPEEVDAFLGAHPTCIVFKASHCHKSDVVFERIRPALETREALPLAMVQVVECRAASNRVEALSGVRHESPQLLLFREGEVVFDRDNWEITESALRGALEELAAPAAPGV